MLRIVEYLLRFQPLAADRKKKRKMPKSPQQTEEETSDREEEMYYTEDRKKKPPRKATRKLSTAESNKENIPPSFTITQVFVRFVFCQHFLQFLFAFHSGTTRNETLLLHQSI